MLGPFLEKIANRMWLSGAFASAVPVTRGTIRTLHKRFPTRRDANVTTTHDRVVSSRDNQRENPSRQVLLHATNSATRFNSKQIFSMVAAR